MRIDLHIRKGVPISCVIRLARNRGFRTVGVNSLTGQVRLEDMFPERDDLPQRVAALHHSLEVAKFEPVLDGRTKELAEVGRQLLYV